MRKKSNVTRAWAIQNTKHKFVVMRGISISEGVTLANLAEWKPPPPKGMYQVVPIEIKVLPRRGKNK